MDPGACPNCGGSRRTALAPGFYECTSPVVIGVVPPGNGTATGTHVRRECGHRYQVGTASGPVAQCGCGMFAVGSCRQCGQSLCGQHATHEANGNVICTAHVAAAQEAAREQAMRKKQAEREAARDSVAAEAEQIAAALPGFPDRIASGRDLAAALKRVVPDRRERFSTGAKSFGRTGRVKGWAFVVNRRPDDNAPSTRLRCRALVVTVDGGLFEVVADRVIDGWTPHAIGSGFGEERTSVKGEDLRKIHLQVLDWLGIPRPSEPPLSWRYEVEFADSDPRDRPLYHGWFRDHG